jgi:hypothetical protein
LLQFGDKITTCEADFYPRQYRSVSDGAFYGPALAEKRNRTIRAFLNGIPGWVCKYDGRKPFSG